jgi:hypothetical protein
MTVTAKTMMSPDEMTARIRELEAENAALRRSLRRMIPEGVKLMAPKRKAAAFLRDLALGKVKGMEFVPVGYDQDWPWEMDLEIFRAGPSHPDYAETVKTFQRQGLDEGVTFRGVKGHVREGYKTEALYFIPEKTDSERQEMFLCFN